MAELSYWELGDLCTPWCVHVVATLRIAEHLRAGRSNISDLAQACGAHAESLHRVLRHLAGKGVFLETAEGQFALNKQGEALLDPGAYWGLNLDGFGGRMAYAWGGLLSTVRTGKPGYHEIFGKPFWEDLEANPKIKTEFDELMGPGHGTPDPEVLVSGSWESIYTIVDVGGGTGSLLAAVLHAHPHLRGILVDLPSTLAGASKVLDAAGVTERATLSGQSFFDPLPSGGDLYLLKSVLADWPDREAVAILKRCSEACATKGRLLVLNGVSPDDAGPASPELLMLVLVGGKQRTLKEFREIALAAGLDVTGTKQAGERFLVECQPR